MSSIALDIRDLPDLADDLESPGENAGPDPSERADDTASDPATGTSQGRAVRPARLRCADCGTVLTVDEPPGGRHDGGLHDADGGAAWRVPVHAVGPAATEPFAARPCPGSEHRADPEADAVPEPESVLPPAPALALPPGLDWRAQPFSHLTA